MAQKDVVVLDWPPPLGVLEKNGATPGDPKSIKDANGTEVDNGFCWAVGTGAGYLSGAIKVQSLQDMVDKILASLAAGDCIKSLAFVGHGAAGVIGTGAGTTWNADAEIDNNRDKWEPQLRRLCGRICKDADEIEVLLLGCNTGVCDKGAAKLYALAKFFKDCIGNAGGRPSVRVYGTKRASAEDVEKAVRQKKRDHLVSVSSTAAEQPACLTQPTDEGMKKKKKKKPARSAKGRSKTEHAITDSRNYTEIAFRDLRRAQGGARGPIAFLEPQPIAVEEFLALYDFATPYEPADVPMKYDGEVFLKRTDGDIEELTISLDYRGLEYSAEGERWLVLLHRPEDAATIEALVTGAGSCPC